MNSLTEIAQLKAQVDRQGKWLRWSMAGWAAVLLVSIVGAAYKRAPFYPEITVGRLALVDANGVKRLILATDSKTARVNGVDKNRFPYVSGIILQNEKGDEVGGFGTSHNGMTVLMLDGYSNRVDAGMSERVGMVVWPDGNAEFRLVDLKGKSRAQIKSGEQLDVDLDLSGIDELPRISGKVTQDGQATWNQ